jgi:hypothetical protein
MTDTQFIRLLEKLASNYVIEESRHHVIYSAKNLNCASWVNSILKESGVSDKVRNKLRRFKGLDVGEKILIPKYKDLFSSSTSAIFP